MTKKSTNWIVLFHRFNKEGQFLSARVFSFCIKAGKERLVLILLASYCQSDDGVWQMQLKDMKESLDIIDEEWEILEMLLGDLRDFRTEIRLASFARVD